MYVEYLLVYVHVLVGVNSVDNVHSCMDTCTCMCSSSVVGVWLMAGTLWRLFDHVIYSSSSRKYVLCSSATHAAVEHVPKLAKGSNFRDSTTTTSPTCSQCHLSPSHISHHH